MCTLHQSTFVGSVMISSRREIICNRNWKNYRNLRESSTPQLWRKLALFSRWKIRVNVACVACRRRGGKGSKGAQEFWEGRREPFPHAHVLRVLVFFPFPSPLTPATQARLVGIKVLCFFLFSICITLYFNAWSTVLQKNQNTDFLIYNLWTAGPRSLKNQTCW